MLPRAASARLRCSRLASRKAMFAPFPAAGGMAWTASPSRGTVHPRPGEPVGTGSVPGGLAAHGRVGPVGAHQDIAHRAAAVGEVRRHGPVGVLGVAFESPAELDHPVKPAEQDLSQEQPVNRVGLLGRVRRRRVHAL